MKLRKYVLEDPGAAVKFKELNDARLEKAKTLFDSVILIGYDKVTIEFKIYESESDARENNQGNS